MYCEIVTIGMSVSFIILLRITVCAVTKIVILNTFCHFNFILGPDLQRILRQTYDSAALTPDLRRACELRAINKKIS